MKKIFFLSTLMLLMAVMLLQNVKAQVSVWDGSYAPWTNGTGTEADPFLIENAQQLAYLAYRVNNGLDAAGGHVSNHDLHYKLMTDVNLSYFPWKSIGYKKSNTNYYVFGGHFDGNNHCIYGLYSGLADTVIFDENFNNGLPATWNLIDADGDGLNWAIKTAFQGHGGIGDSCISSASYWGNALTPDNWLISPAIEIPNNVSVELSFWVCAQDASWPTEHYGVYITTSTDCTNVNNYTLLLEETIDANGGSRQQGAWKEKTCHLSSYAGQSIHIAFRHFNCTDQYFINMDDFVIRSISSYGLESDYVGLFGYTEGSMIENLNLNYDVIYGARFPIIRFGSLIGSANETTIKNCSNNGNSIEAMNNNTYVGGLVGYSSGNLSIINSSNTANIASGLNSGGIVGYSTGDVSIINSYNKGNISFNSFSGGIVGYSTGDLCITNSYNTGSISSNSSSGGIVGRSIGNMSITNSYNTGFISSSNTNIGGIVGYGIGHITNCFYLNTCGGNNIYGGSPMSSAAMQTPEFVDMLNNSSCAWEQDITPFVNDGYPVLTMILQDAFTEPATDLTANSANLHGSVDVEHAIITSKGFEYRELGDSIFISVNVTSNDNTFTYTLNGLTPNTTYEYRTFVNVSECPYTSYGDLQTFEVSWLNADTILIYDADMLQWVSDRCNTGTTFEGKYIKLMNNIVLPLNQPNNMTSIGVYPSYPFKGTFDGNGMLISVNA